MDEYEYNITQEVEHEWMPIQCLKCKTFGYSCEEDDQLENPEKQTGN